MGTRTRLSILMGLAYAVQGAWWPMLAVHLTDLGVSGRGRGWIFATLALSAMVAPPIAGRIADRRIAAQRLLALIYAAGAVLLAASAVGLATTFAGLFPLFLAYWLLTAPYLGLTNTIAMRNLDRPREQFGGVRLWGTVGWMAAGWLVSGLMSANGHGPGSKGVHESFWIASALSVMISIACLIQPDTPPLASGTRGIPWRDLTHLIRRPGVVVLLIAGFGVSMTTPFVYQAVPVYLRYVGLSESRVGSAMTLGQILEILALGMLPKVMDRLGRKATMLVGIAAWMAYHGLFVCRPGVPIALAAISLNGIAIAFFHVTAPMYLDTQAPPDHRAGVQSLWVMVTAGLGSLTGGLLAGEVMERAGGDWRLVFTFPAAINAALLVGFLLLFRSREKTSPRGDEEIVSASGVPRFLDRIDASRPATSGRS